MSPAAPTDLQGRVFLITGASSGIGLVTARVLAGRGAELLLASRSGPKAAAALAELRRLAPAARIDAFDLDLGDLASVRACAAQVLAGGRPLHALINNAGLAGQRGATRDGFELAFGVNHLGHFLLTNLLLERLRASAPARIVNVASRAHRRVGGIDFAALQRPTRTLTGMREYGVSKLCNLLFTRELARRLAGSGVTVYAVHPGRVATDVWRSIPGPVAWWLKRSMLSPEAGAEPILTCATAPELAAHSGRYYEPGGEAQPTAVASDDALAARLWADSARWTGLSGAARS